MKIMFVEAHSKQDIVSAVEASLLKLKGFNKVGLATTSQHIHKINEAANILKKAGKIVVFSSTNKSAEAQGIRSTYKCQVLGCDATLASANVDCFLYIGTGSFHPLAIAVELDKPVFCVDLFSKQVTQFSEQEKRRLLAKRAARLSKLKDSKNIGILVCTKPGQYKPKLAESIKDKLESEGKKVFLFIDDTLNPTSLIDFSDIDCWINTACPRLVDDKWPKLVVNANEVLS